MEIIRTDNPLEFELYANNCLNGHSGCVICINALPCVWTGELRTFDLDACGELYVGRGKYLGGTIVCMPGDLSICITTWGNSELAPQIVDNAADWLSERGIAISRDGNDVMADGKKVISWAMATTLSGWCQSVVHFSIGQMDLELVNAICTKPMEKIPGSLGEYSITAEMILSTIQPLINKVKG